MFKLLSRLKRRCPLSKGEFRDRMIEWSKIIEKQEMLVRNLEEVLQKQQISFEKSLSEQANNLSEIKTMLLTQQNSFDENKPIFLAQHNSLVEIHKKFLESQNLLQENKDTQLMKLQILHEQNLSILEYQEEARRLHFEHIWESNVSMARIDQNVSNTEKVLTNYKEQRDIMYWQLYKQRNETTAEGKKRFFLSLPAAIGKLRQMQQLETILLNALKSICERNDLQYWLWGGSILGAVRHEGFIPWDDDIDVGMMRGDLEKLRVFLERDKEFKIDVKYDACVFCKQVRFRFKKAEISAFVDIFMYDYCSDVSEEVNSLKMQIKKEMHNELMTSNDEMLICFRKELVVDEDSLVGMDVKKIFDKYYQRLVDTGIILENLNKTVKGLFYGIDNCDIPNKAKLDRLDYYFPLKQLIFEKQSFYLPNEYMSILYGLYGEDIMSFPKGAPHFAHVDWESQSESVIEELNMYNMEQTQ